MCLLNYEPGDNGKNWKKNAAISRMRMIDRFKKSLGTGKEGKKRVHDSINALEERRKLCPKRSMAGVSYWEKRGDRSRNCKWWCITLQPILQEAETCSCFCDADHGDPEEFFQAPSLQSLQEVAGGVHDKEDVKLVDQKRVEALPENSAALTLPGEGDPKVAAAVRLPPFLCTLIFLDKGNALQ